MKNIFIYLIGFPGTGKYTTALEIQKQEPSFRVVDNHLINNVLFTLLGKDICSRVWTNIGKIWDIVLDTLAKDAPKEYSYIMTNVLLESNKKDKRFFRLVSKIAKRRGAIFIPVRLVCELNQLEQRIINPDRALRHKLMDSEVARRLSSTDKVLDIRHPNLLTLDTTQLSASDAAAVILQHARTCAT